jgi:hypothetical protein
MYHFSSRVEMAFKILNLIVVACEVFLPISPSSTFGTLRRGERGEIFTENKEQV